MNPNGAPSLHFLDDIAAALQTEAKSAPMLLGNGEREKQAFSANLLKSEALINAVESGHALVGQLPPKPPTLRGRIGRVLIHVVRRSLFWYTAAVVSFQHSVAAAFREHGETMANLEHTLVDQQSRASVLASNVSARCDSVEQQLEHVQMDLNGRLDSFELGLIRQRELQFTEVIEQIQQQVSALSAQLREEVQHLRGELASAREQLSVSAKELQMVDRFTRSTRAEMILLERRLSKQASQTTSDIAGGARFYEGFSDVMYYDFEQLFRGSEEEIKARVQEHLPRVQQLSVGTADMPILDLGCGRGEWL